MQDGLGAPLVRGVSHLRTEDIVLQEGDAPRVLHRAGVELGHEQLVELVERVAVAERLVIPVEAVLGDQKDLVGIEVLGQRGPAVDAEIDAVVAIGHFVVGTRYERGHIRRQRWSGHEADHLPASGVSQASGRSSVGDDFPVGRRGHG